LKDYRPAWLVPLFYYRRIHVSGTPGGSPLEPIQSWLFDAIEAESTLVSTPTSAMDTRFSAGELCVMCRRWILVISAKAGAPRFQDRAEAK
jgi:hypothetical protein